MELRYARSTVALPALTDDWVHYMVTPLDWQPAACLSLINDGDRPFIAFVAHAADWALRFASAGSAEPDELDWLLTTGPGYPTAFFGLSLAAFGEGRGVSAYLNGSPADLIYMSTALSTPTDPADWQAHTVQSESNVGYPCALMNINGAPAIAYNDDPFWWVMFAQASGPEPAAEEDWERHMVADCAGPIVSLDAAVVNGNPCIAYVVDGDVLCAWAKTATPRLPRDWAFSTAASDFTDDYDDVSVADVGGHPGISFYNSTTEHLMYTEITL